MKGALSPARGDYLWTAEADDHQRSGLSWSAWSQRPSEPRGRRSRSSELGTGRELKRTTVRPLGESYKDYYRSAAGNLMDRDFELRGEEFVSRCLAERNLVLNVSSVLWNRSRLNRTLQEEFDQILGYKLMGDWHLYASTALRGKVAYVSEALNVHRRHASSVTQSLDKREHLGEVRAVQEAITNWITMDRETRDRMRAYEQELSRQFGLHTN